MGFNPCEKQLYDRLVELRDVAGFPQPGRWENYPGKYVCVTETDVRVYAPTFDELERFFLRKCRDERWFGVGECGLSVERHHRKYSAVPVAHHRLQYDIVGYGKWPEIACLNLILQYAALKRPSKNATITPLDPNKRKMCQVPPTSNVRKIR